MEHSEHFETILISISLLHIEVNLCFIHHFKYGICTMSKTIVLKLYIVLEQRILYPLILQDWQLDIISGVAILLVKYAYISS